MLKKLLLLIIASLVIAPSAMARLEAKRGVVSNGYNFWLYEPDSATVDTPKPVVIFLHGASLCGNNLDRVRRYGTIDAIERGRNLDAYVIAPQNPGGSWSPMKVMNCLDYVMEHNNVDSTRVYVIGMSLGGYGTIDVAATYPNRVAAAMAFCGGGTVKNLQNLNNIPLWIVHGTADRAVPVVQSDKVVEAMKSADNSTPRLIYDRVPGMNHSQPARFFYLSECYEWLFTHSLLDEDRPITEGFDLTGSMKQAYDGLKHNPNKAKTTKKKKSRRTHARARSKKKSTRKSR